MDFQKNDIYKSELVGNEIYTLVYIFSGIYGPLVSITLLSIIIIVVLSKIVISIYYFASFSNNYLLSIIIIVALSKIVISNHYKIIINSIIFDYITNDSKREK